MMNKREHPALHVQAVASPLGDLLLAATDRGLCGLEFGAGEDRIAQLFAWAERHIGASELRFGHPILEDAERQLQQYFGGERRAFELPLDLHGTPFQLRVWQELTRIPYGETRSYKDIAYGIGSPQAVRAVGGANNRNPMSIIVPCHRVIGSNGALVGYGGGLPMKTHLLQLEGIDRRTR
jgi:methylated-DNA-[protein]-cysteine S-methyltransferase